MYAVFVPITVIAIAAFVEVVSLKGDNCHLISMHTQQKCKFHDHIQIILHVYSYLDT